jgi:imidazolonepropionase-like amidohydrolase
MFEKKVLMHRITLAVIAVIFCSISTLAQAKADTFYLLKPDRVFDGEQMHEGWQVLVKNKKIEEVGDIKNVPRTAIVIELKGCTLLPGLIEGHSHLFLHPYNETKWEDQVLKESRTERTARAVNHARATLLAGFTTVRDLGTEGAQYDDVGLKTAIIKGVIPGPHVLTSTKAIVIAGSYAPRPASPDLTLPQGAAEVGNKEELAKEVRTQLGRGADWIKLYADYRVGGDTVAQPTFTEEEMRTAVQITTAGKRLVAAHASTAEGMRRAALAGVATIEHGDEGTAEVFRLMKEKGVAYCPTLAATEAVAQYDGWKKGSGTVPESVQQKHKSFAAALAAGVTICMGGDVGVFTHGDNAREMELMVEYGMKPDDVLRSATSVNADVFKINHKTGRIKAGLLADILIVEGNPLTQMAHIRKVKLVMKEGKIVK